MQRLAKSGRSLVDGVCPREDGDPGVVHGGRVDESIGVSCVWAVDAYGREDLKDVERWRIADFQLEHGGEE